MSPEIRAGELPDIVKLVFGFAILPREVMIRGKNSLGERPRLLKVSQTESIDIDTPHDFEVAEFLYKKTIYKNRVSFAQRRRPKNGLYV